jgi:hypothetical protein
VTPLSVGPDQLPLAGDELDALARMLAMSNPILLETVCGSLESLPLKDT